MPKLNVSLNKSFKLNNALIYTVDFNNKDLNLEKIIELMESFVLSKGAKPLGPLIQYTEVIINEDGESSTILKLIRQCNTYINKIDSDYQMESVLRVKDCMYCRYIGSEAKSSIVYDKIGVEAYENDIELIGNAYTIYVDEDEANETVTTDVFMPKA